MVHRADAPTAKVGAAKRRETSKTLVFTAVVVACQVIGNSLLSWAMKQQYSVLPGVLHGFLPLAAEEWLAPFFSVFLWLGIALLVVSLLSRMTLLTWADLSFVAPVAAIGYVLNVAAGALLLGETVDARRWIGSLLVVAGTALVGMTLHAHGPAPSRADEEQEANSASRERTHS
jgi:drug/metabolite transporter (DMT)-like permease